MKKPVIYEQIGVKEYFIYDPTCDYLEPALQGYRMIDGYLKQIKPINGMLECETLQLGLRLIDQDLEFFDLGTGEIALDAAQAEREAREAEREAKEAERAAKEAERAAKERALAKNQELQQEIERLKKMLGES